MSSLLVVAAASFATGVVVTLAAMARFTVRNRRRIERLERRLKAHELVIRHLAEESIDPDGPIPPARPTFRVIKGGAAVGVLVALVRARPAAVAAGSLAAATALAVAVAVFPPPAAGTGALGVAPTSAGVQAPVSTPSSSSAPSSPHASPSGMATQGASTSAATAGASSTTAVSATTGATAVPVLRVPASLLSAIPSLPSPTGSVLPSVSVPASASPTLSLPSASATGTCLIGLQVPPLVDVCVP